MGEKEGWVVEGQKRQDEEREEARSDYTKTSHFLCMTNLHVLQHGTTVCQTVICSFVANNASDNHVGPKIITSSFCPVVHLCEIVIISI